MPADDAPDPTLLTPPFRAWREKSGLTQDQLAARLGLTKSAVSRIESGKRGWGAEYLAGLAGVLSVPPEALLTHPDDYQRRGRIPMSPDWTRVQDAIRAFQAGEIVVVTDDDDRENEGDLFVAASLCTAENMAFIVRHTSGIVCAPMVAEEARRLKLDPMVAVNDAPLSTAFTVSVDVRHGLTTGISAEERSNTVRALANGNAQADDFVRPGHVFPLVAREGGVLMRSGHTEACVDLCTLAGLPPVGVLAELVNDDGTVKRGDEVDAFAADHGLKQVSVAELIAYRQARERLVERLPEFQTRTPAGPATGIPYTTRFEDAQHLALVFGDIGDGNDILVRLHRESIISDVFGERSGLTQALDQIKTEGRGVVVYLRDGTTGVPATRLAPDAYGAARDGEGSGSAEERAELWREVGLGAQILRDLGISSIRLLASKSRHYVGLSGFGIAIAETIFLDN